MFPLKRNKCFFGALSFLYGLPGLGSNTGKTDDFFFFGDETMRAFVGVHNKPLVLYCNMPKVYHNIGINSVPIDN